MFCYRITVTLVERMFDMAILYLRLKRKISVNEKTIITLKDVAHVSINDHRLDELQKIPLYQVSPEDAEYVVIDGFHIVRFIQQYDPEITIEILGTTESIVHIKTRKRNVSILFVCFVWLVLFIGAAMTIVNFHYDVSMQEVHQKIHFLFTGTHEKYPLFIQIPYSIGLGVGMILFLNHWFKKRLNEEPSPLELELFQYKRRVDDYIARSEERRVGKEYRARGTGVT